MKSTFDILTAIFKSVKPAFSGLISGNVYIGNPPTGDQLENITLNTLRNPSGYVQKGVLNANIELMETEKGVANTRRFKELLDILLPLMDDKAVFDTNITVHLSIEDDKGIFPVQDSTGKYLYNLRVEFTAL
tara:strand:+ start:9420 stop:9815 length:396 start_codon:yes stop_codon:yes gene_type:complete